MLINLYRRYDGNDPDSAVAPAFGFYFSAFSCREAGLESSHGERYYSKCSGFVTSSKFPLNITDCIY